MGKEPTTRSALLLLIFVVLGTYYPAIFSPLNSIDDPRMYDYLLNTDAITLREIFLPGGGGYYRPVLLLTFLADKYLWGLQESFMHLDNVLIHLLNSVLVFAIARKSALLQGTRSTLLPLCAALLFAVHPVNAEAVNWISGRTDPLAALFILLSVLLMMGEPGPFRNSLCALSLLTACLAKETAVFFLPAALVIPFFRVPWLREEGSLRGTLVRYRWHFLSVVAVGAAYLVLRTLAFGASDGAVNSLANCVATKGDEGMLVKLSLVLKSAGFYLKKLFAPFPLNFGINHVSALYLPVGLLLLLLLLWLLKRRTLPALFFICAASVASSALLVPLVAFTWTPLAERYLYIPSAFFVMGMTFSVHGWHSSQEHRRLLGALVAAVLAVGVYGTATRTLLWQDNLALFRDTVRKSPDFIPAQNEVACALYAQGRDAEAAALMMSLPTPKGLLNYQFGLMNKSFACRRRGDFAGARSYLNEALRNPGKQEVQICLELLKLNEAEIEGGKAERRALYPESARLMSRVYQLTANPFYQYRLGQLHMFQGEKRLAGMAFALAAARAPAGAVYREPARKLAAKMSY